MIAHFGFQDASGDYFIAIDLDACTGCGDCASMCPSQILEMVANPFDPLDERVVAVIRPGQERRLRLCCAACKTPARAGKPSCLAACSARAIRHSW